MRPRRAALATAFTVAISVGALAAIPAPAGADGSTLTGGGSSFAALEIDQWKGDTAREPYNLSINYVAQGSTFGRFSFGQNTLEFAATDIEYEPTERGALGERRCAGKNIDNGDCFVYVPVSAGGVSFMYNLVDGSGQRVTDLRLTRRAVCGIFSGALTQWNNPEIVATNPRLASLADDRKVRPVVRADGAGESFVFSEYCIAVAPDVWREFIPRVLAEKSAEYEGTPFARGEPTSSWPKDVGLINGVAPADNLANYVADPGSGKDAIGYVAAGYAKVTGNPVAAVENGAGEFTKPDEENVTVALGYATGLPNGTFDLAYDGPDVRAYFPSTYSYMLAQTAGYDPARGRTLGTFLCYAVTRGQADAVKLGYARLSRALVDIAINAISRVPGAPAPENCNVAGAPPPPPDVVVEGGPAGGNAAGPGAAATTGTTGAGAGSGAPAAGTTTPGGNRAATAGSAAGTLTADAAAAGVASGVDEGSSGVTAGNDSTDAQDEETPERIDDELAAAASGIQTPRSSALPTIWILLAGIACAWIVQALFKLRRRPS